MNEWKENVMNKNQKKKIIKPTEAWQWRKMYHIMDGERISLALN